MDAMFCEESLDILPALLGILKPHLMASIRQDNALALRKQPGQLIRNESEEGIRLRAREQQKRSCDLVNRVRVQIREQRTRRHHDIPLVPIAKSFLPRRV